MLKKYNEKKLGMKILAGAILVGTMICPTSNVKAINVPKIEYSAHVENKGWLPAVTSGVAGTTGQSLRVEAIKVNLINPQGVQLKFDVHIQNIGWIRDVSQGIIGTEGKGLRMEAIRVYADGLKEKGYKLQYRAHVEKIGWQDWKEAGELAGTEGLALRIEALEFRILIVDSEIKQPRKCEGLYSGQFYEKVNEGSPLVESTATYFLQGDGTFVADIDHSNSGLVWTRGFFQIYGNTISLTYRNNVGESDKKADPLYETLDYIMADDCSYIKIPHNDATNKYGILYRK